MADKTVSKVDLVGLTSLSFIRPITINYRISGTKPNTRLYPFFDGKNVSKHVTPTGGTKGQSVITDASGNATGTFDIPARTFNTGERELKFQDNSFYDIDSIPGATTGSATAFFTSAGLLRTFQETITNTTIRENIVRLPRPVPPPPPRRRRVWSSGGQREQNDSNGRGDPLAQTFFTHGIKGGCFITKIDLYFQSRDASLPVELQIRDVVNGYPGQEVIASVIKQSSSINLSNNASAVTTFTFDIPIYLEENMDYCFVLLSNSNKYHVWTSELGKTSIETGKVIFEQPHLGSLFKSENNVTWSASQTEDIKFTLYKAKFDTSVERGIEFKALAPPVIIPGSMMSVTSGSAVVTVELDFQHGYKTGDKIHFNAQDGASYRGISATTFENSSGFTVTKLDDYKFTFNVGTNATSTGTLETSGILNSVEVDDGGTGYVSPVITITGGSGATASATVVDGEIAEVTVTNPGSGFLEEPSYSISDSGGGSGAVLAPISEALFVASINRPFQTAAPVVNILMPPDTDVENTLRTCSKDYIIGLHEFHELNETLNVGQDAIISTRTNELSRLGSNVNTQMITRISSTNPNVSPMIDLVDDPPRLQMHNFLINGVSNAGSETGNEGTAYSRYISKTVSLETVSVGARVFVNASSVDTTWFDVFIRTSLSTTDTDHSDNTWVKMNCDVNRNLSSNIDEYKDYEFYLETTKFDVYDIKIVLYSENKYLYPIIDNYRVIILAT